MSMLNFVLSFSSFLDTTFWINSTATSSSSSFMYSSTFSLVSSVNFESGWGFGSCSVFTISSNFFKASTWTFETISVATSRACSGVIDLLLIGSSTSSSWFKISQSGSMTSFSSACFRFEISNSAKESASNASFELGVSPSEIAESLVFSSVFTLLWKILVSIVDSDITESSSWDKTCSYMSSLICFWSMSLEVICWPICLSRGRGLCSKCTFSSVVSASIINASLVELSFADWSSCFSRIIDEWSS